MTARSSPHHAAVIRAQVRRRAQQRPRWDALSAQMGIGDHLHYLDEAINLYWSTQSTDPDFRPFDFPPSKAGWWRRLWGG